MKNDISGSLDNFFKAVLMWVWGQQDPTAILSQAQFAVKHVWERENSSVSRNSKGKAIALMSDWMLFSTMLCDYEGKQDKE